jgi:hypothetical protein
MIIRHVFTIEFLSTINVSAVCRIILKISCDTREQKVLLQLSGLFHSSAGRAAERKVPLCLFSRK